MMWIALLLMILASLALFIWRICDHQADARAIRRLVSGQPKAPAHFDVSMLAALPEPARRYFLFTIEPGTPLYTVAIINMAGRFGMGTKAKPDYLEMRARQVLTVPAGFVWKMQARRGLLRLSGSDSEKWTRFWLMGLLPVARLGGDDNHRRSAFGRYVAEAVFWTPACLLPGPGIQWQQQDKDCARVTVSYRGLSQSIDITVAADGRPVHVSFERWSNANADKHYRLQPFGGYLSEFRNVAGFRLPIHVEAGNQFGTEHYFPFFVADIKDISFPEPEPGR